MEFMPIRYFHMMHDVELVYTYVGIGLQIKGYYKGRLIKYLSSYCDLTYKSFDFSAKAEYRSSFQVLSYSISIVIP